MNSMFYPGRKALEPDVREVFARVTFGSSGAPTLDVAKSRGIASITRISAGQYDVKFSDTFVAFLFAKHVFLQAAAPAAPNMRVLAEQVATSSAPKITIQFDAAGTATDPASGEEVRLNVVCKDSIA